MKTTVVLSLMLLIVLEFLLIPDTAADTAETQWALPENAITRLGKGGIAEIQYSPDGTLLAVASDIGIWFYDTAGYHPIALFTGHTEPVLSVALGSDGRTFVSGSRDGTLRFWDRDTGAHKTRLTVY